MGTTPRTQQQGYERFRVAIIGGGTRTSVGDAVVAERERTHEAYRTVFRYCTTVGIPVCGVVVLLARKI